MDPREVRFPVEGLTLEGLLHLPSPQASPAGGLRLPGVVVCHPHPLYGGNMHVLMIAQVCRELSHKGMAALRFNFRGTGASEGTHGEGIAEQQDVASALTFLGSLPEVDEDRLGVVGYSFGAFVGLAAGARDQRVKALAAIAPPGSLVDLSFLKGSSQPKFLIFGSKDGLAPAEPVLALLRESPGENRYEVVEGADHFFLGYEEVVARKVAEYLAETI